MAKKSKKNKKKQKTTKSSQKATPKRGTNTTPQKATPDFFEEVLGKKSIYVAIGAVFFVALSLYGSFLLGNQVFLYKDIGSDTINAYYPNMYMIDQMLAEGVPGWSFKRGMGQNIFPFSISDPYNVFLYLFFSSDNLAKGFAVIEFLKVVSGGLFFVGFLRTRGLNYFSAITGGMLYASSGFMIVGSTWFIFTTEAAYVALLLWAFERLLTQGKWVLFPIAIMLISAVQPVNVFVSGLLLGLYAIIRMLEYYEYDFKKMGLTLVKMAALGALGVGLSGFSLLPTLDQMLNSPRVLGDSSFFDTLSGQSVFSTVDAKQGLTIIGRLLANDFLGDASQFTGWYNYLEAPMHYAGLATLLLVPQAFALMTKQKRILYGVMLTVVLLPLIFPFLRYAVWLFAGDYYRMYSLIVIVGLLVVALQGLHLIHEKKKVNLIVLGVSLVFTLFLTYYPFGNAAEYQVAVDASTQQYVAFFLVAYAALIASWKVEGLRPMTKFAFLALVAIELLSLSSGTLSGRDVMTKTELDQKIYYNDYSVDAVQYINSIEEAPFFRVSKTYFSGGAMHASTNDANIQGYNGTKSYHSFNQLNYVRFLGAVNLIDPTVENQTRWTPGLAPRQLLNMMASNKYILSKQGQAQVGHGYTPIHTVGDVTIHQNQNFIPFGFTYDKVLSRSNFDQLSNLKKDISLLKAAVIEDEDLAKLSALAKFDTTSIPANYTLDLLAADAQARGAVSLNVNTFSNSNIKGDINLSEDRILFFSMPLDKGWHATIDGQPAELLKANAGLTGLLVPKGQHTIELTYHIPYLQKGLLISLISLLLFGASVWWFNYRKGTKPKSTASEETV